MTLSAAEETELLARYRAGDRKTRDLVFATLYEQHRARVFSLCLHLTGSRRDAEDAVQESFLSLHRSLDRFRGDARLSTWLHRVAIRASLAISTERATVPLDEQQTNDNATGDPARDLVARQQMQRLRVAMAELSAEQRAVISLFAVEGMAHGEIAATLGVPEGTIWSRLHNARKQLMMALDSRNG